MNNGKLVLISGASGSGKSTLADLLSKYFIDFAAISQDSFCKDRKLLLENNSYYSLNHDSPDVIEHDLLLTAVTNCLRGETINIPFYDYKDLSRKGGFSFSSTNLIVEGIHAFYDERLVSQACFSIFLDLPLEDSIERRVERDKLHRKYNIDESNKYIDEYVIPMYLEHVYPRKKYASFILKKYDDVPALIETMRNILT
ncbi:uridine kinase [Vibrio cholerae]